MFPRTHSFIVLLSIFLGAAPAYAAVADILEDDLDSLSTQLEADAQAHTLQEEERSRESTDELFPELPLDPKGTLEQRREERTGEFVSVTQGGVAVVFRDVPLREWFAPYVRAMAEKGIIGGYKDAQGNPLGLFAPGNPVSIEELAKLLTVQTGAVSGACPSATRNPTASGSWSSPYMACAEAKGWTVYSDGTVDAKRPATRAEVIATVLEAYGKEPAEAKGGVFTDVEASMQFAGAIEQAKADGLVGGYTDAQGNPTGQFGPDDAVTRAETAKMLWNAMSLYATAAG